jgi:uncharacterized protein YlxW (UPF0749 family)
LLAAGLLFTTSALAARNNELVGSSRQVDLVGLVDSRQDRVESLEKQVASLRGQIDARTAERPDSDSGPLGQALDEADAYAPLAGVAPLSGTAVIVTLNDAPDVPPPAAMPVGVSVDDYVVHQQDLEGVINALWAGGATAMMVMDQRVISTSAVRCVGTVLSLQGRTYSPPYRIAAIGDSDALRRALSSSPSVSIYREYVDELGLGYKVETSARESFPAYRGALALQYARAGPGAGAIGEATGE